MSIAGTQGLLGHLRRPLRQIHARTGRLRGLGFLWLEITRSCNLTCRHCYAGSAPELPILEGMRFQDWCRVVDEAAAIGCRRLQFIGGEPTIHPDLENLIAHAAGAGFFSEVFTNATHLPDRLLRVFERFGVRVAFSFYSPDASDHDGITGHQGSFQRTVDGVTRLVRSRIPVRAGIILTPETAPKVEETQKLLRRLGVRSMEVDRVRGIGRAEALVPSHGPREELCGQCWNRKLCVTANGDAFPCVFSRFVTVGNVLSEGIKSIVDGRPLGGFRRQIYLGKKGG